MGFHTTTLSLAGVVLVLVAKTVSTVCTTTVVSGTTIARAANEVNKNMAIISFRTWSDNMFYYFVKLFSVVKFDGYFAEEDLHFGV